MQEEVVGAGGCPVSKRKVTERSAKERSNFKNGISHSTAIGSQLVKYKALLVYLTKILQSCHLI